MLRRRHRTGLSANNGPVSRNVENVWFEAFSSNDDENNLRYEHHARTHLSD